MSRLIAATLGRIVPAYRLFSDWTAVYKQLIQTRPLKPKTLQNRMCNVGHLEAAFAGCIISRIRPHEVARVIMEIYAEHPAAARRVLIEARELFGEAVGYGWIDRNPAESVRQVSVRVQRRRLSLEQWHAIHDWAKRYSHAWVPRMLVLAIVSAQRRADLQKFRFDDVADDHLHVIQQKTGECLRLPLALRLDAIGVTLEQAIEGCRDYARDGDCLLRKSTGEPFVCASLSSMFAEARDAALGPHSGPGAPPSLHECRSLAERLYRAQGVDTRTLLGHKRQSMTDMYNDPRGLDAGRWKTLVL